MIPCANPKAQYLSYQEEIESVIHQVLESGWYILGKEVRKFEQEFSAYIGTNKTIGVGSGTEALHMALRALEIGSGDEVITVSHTAVATASAIILSGAKPVFVDIEPDYFTIDPNLVEAAITSKTKAIIPVHLYGQPCDMNALMEIAQKYGLNLIEDCAQAHGSNFRGHRVGSIGDIGCFSFYPTKNLGAIGDGGALTTNNNKLEEKTRLMREYGWKERYISIDEGWNSRLDELQTAILRVKLRGLDADNGCRQRHALKYENALKKLPIDLPVVRNECTHVFHLYVIKTDHRDQLKAYLQKHKIMTTIQYPIPIHLQNYYLELGDKYSLPITEKTATTILSLPMFPELQESEQQHVIDVLEYFFTGIS